MKKLGRELFLHFSFLDYPYIIDSVLSFLISININVSAIKRGANDVLASVIYTDWRLFSPYREEA